MEIGRKKEKKEKIGLVFFGRKKAQDAQKVGVAGKR